jgi:acyl-CoA thioesterase-2
VPEKDVPEEVPATSDPSSELLRLLDLERIEVNLFRGIGISPARRRRVFGGQVAAQALQAACLTVPVDRPVHSLHSYFLRPGDPRIPIVYEVDRIRDGGSFTSRRVVAIQKGEAIFHLSASFQVVEPGPDHAMAMPDVRGPEELPTYQEHVDAVRGKLDPEVAGLLGEERPIEIRPVETPHWRAPNLRPPAQDMWLRARGRLPDDPVLHACVFTYASDLTLSDTAALPHELDILSGASVMRASLDHAIWFHRPFRVDEWFLYHLSSPSAFGARGLSLGYVFRADGVLVATVMQEGLLRPLRPATPSA